MFNDRNAQTTKAYDKSYFANLDEGTKPKVKKPPSLATMERWVSNGVAKATDGCRVEPDGHCQHGKPSWLIKLGYI